MVENGSRRLNHSKKLQRNEGRIQGRIHDVCVYLLLPHHTDTSWVHCHGISHFLSLSAQRGACLVHWFLQTGQEFLVLDKPKKIPIIPHPREAGNLHYPVSAPNLFIASLFSQISWAPALLCLDKKHIPEAGELTHTLHFNLNIPPLKLVAERWLRPFKIHRLPCKLIKDLINMTVKFYFCRPLHFWERNRRIGNHLIFLRQPPNEGWHIKNSSLQIKALLKIQNSAGLKQMSNLCISVILLQLSYETQCIFLTF